MLGKIIIGLCVAASLVSLTFGSPLKLESTTSKPEIEKFEQVHVCVPSDSCGGSKSVVGINIEYTCSCTSGYSGQWCNISARKSVTENQIRSFVERNPTIHKAGQPFYCEYQGSNCEHGVTVIESKTPICS